MRKLCCVVLALLPLSAFAYPIDVTKKINGVSVDYTASDVDGDIGSIQLNNYGTRDALCSVTSPTARNHPVAVLSACRQAKAPTPPSSSTARSSRCVSHWNVQPEIKRQRSMPTAILRL